MATKTVAISLDVAAAQRFQDAAKAAGISFSTYMSRAAQREYLRQQSARYREHMASLTGDDAAVADDWTATVHANLTGVGE